MFFLEFDVFSHGKFLIHKSIQLNCSDIYMEAFSFLDGFTHPLFSEYDDLTVSSITIVEK